MSVLRVMIFFLTIGLSYQVSALLFLKYLQAVRKNKNDEKIINHAPNRTAGSVTGINLLEIAMGHPNVTRRNQTIHVLDSMYIKNQTILSVGETIPSEFAISTKLMSMKKEGGHLFAIKNCEDSLIQFGVQLKELDKERHTLVLYYTKDEHATSSVAIATFNMSTTFEKWTDLLLISENNKISLYVNCTLQDEVSVDYINASLKFKRSSTLYLFQAVHGFHGTNFVGDIKELTIFKHPVSARDYCDDNMMEPDLNGSGSGSQGDTDDDEDIQ